MSPRRALRIALCLALLGTVVGTAAHVAAAPPPRPLCDACGDSFEETADAHGVAVAVERSTATVSVARNGSATWVVRNRLDDSGGASRLRTNDSLRADVADRAMWDAEPLGSNVSADGVLTMRYRDPSFAERSVGGALRSGAFTESHGYRNLDGLGADRLAVVAPDGTRLGWTAPGASVSDDGRRMTLTAFDDGGFVTFVPRGSRAGPLLSLVAVASLLGPVTAANALAFVVVPTAVFSLLVGATAGARSWLARDTERHRNASGTGLAVLGAAVAALAVGVSVLGSPVAPVVGTGVAFALVGVGLSRSGVCERATYRRLVVAAALGALAAGGGTVAASALLARGGATVSGVLPFLVPVFALLPAGYASGRGDRRLAVGTAAVAFGLASLPLLFVVSSPFGLGGLLVLLVAGYAAVAAAGGAPLFVVGAGLAAERQTGD